MSRHARASRTRAFVAPLVLIVGFLLLWEVYARRAGLGDDVLPPPSRIWNQGWEARELLWENTLPTLRATALGFSLSLLVGFVLSVLIDASGVLRSAVLPVLVVTQTLPLIAIAPLMILWFGFELTPKVLIVALVTFFPITVSLVEGYAAVDRDAETLLGSMGAGRLRIFRSLRFPTAMPYFFAGLRIAITYAVVAAIFAEYAGASEGLGIFMQNAKNSFRTDLVLAAVGVSAAITLVLFAATYLLERIAIPWYRLSRVQGGSS
jgi:ABC-type nitrate/sulfonate/bicarbonate transport system permease component